MYTVQLSNFYHWTKLSLISKWVKILSFHLDKPLTRKERKKKSKWQWFEDGHLTLNNGPMVSCISQCLQFVYIFTTAKNKWCHMCVKYVKTWTERLGQHFNEPLIYSLSIKGVKNFNILFCTINKLKKTPFVERNDFTKVSKLFLEGYCCYTCICDNKGCKTDTTHS